MKAPFTVVADVGLHHGGDVKRAISIADAAYACGVDVAKFQFFVEADLAMRPKGTGWDVLQRYALNAGEMRRVIEECHPRACGMSFFGEAGIEAFADSMWMLGLLKVPAPQSERRCLIGTLKSWASLHNSRLAVSYYPDQMAIADTDVTLLHCTRKYPTPDDELQLGRISTMPACAEVGWSCHAEARHPVTAELACLAYAAGARTFEFHFRDDKVLPGSPDYDVSVWPDLMAYTIQQLRRCARIMGA